MANSSIEIEIVANFKDNATDKVRALNAELDKLEKRNININVGTDDKASKIVDDMEHKLDKIDGSKATQAIDELNNRADAITGNTQMVDISADTSKVDSALDRVKYQLDDISNTTVNVSAGSKEVWPDSMFHLYHENVSSTPELKDAADVLEEIPRARHSTISSEHYGYDQSVMDYIDAFASKHGGVSNSPDVPDNFWTATATQSDKEAYRSGKMSALALAELSDAVNPDALSPEDRAEYDKFKGIGAPSTSTSIKDEEPRVEILSGYQRYNSAEIESYVDAYANGTLNDGMAPKEDGLTPASEFGTQVADSWQSFGKKMATRMFGVQATYSGIQDIASDFTDAYSADNGYDSRRSLTRGLTKGGLMGAGALVGSFFGNPLFGAGAGAMIGNLFGDDLADTISGITKSAEELKQERLDEIFGDIAMSAEDLNKVVLNMFDEDQVERAEAHRAAISNEYSLKDRTDASYYDVGESGAKLNIKGNLGIPVSGEETDAYKTQAENYIKSAKETLTQSMYDAFMFNDDLFGYGQWDTTELSNKYKTLFEDLENHSDELETALSNNDYSRVFEIISNTQKEIRGATADEGDIKSDSYSFLAKSGLLSQGSYDSLISDIEASYGNDLSDLSNNRARAIASGSMTEAEADKWFWNSANTKAESYLQAEIDSTKDVYGNDYASALADAWEGKTNAAGEQYTGISMLYDGASLFSRRMNSAESNSRAGLNLQASKEMKWAKDAFMNSFDEVDAGTQGAMGEAYSKLQSSAERSEVQARASKAAGVDPSGYIDEMMSIYQIGALGGDESAQEKYAAMLMAGDERKVQSMNAVYGNDYKAMAKDWGEDFADMWQFLQGTNSAEAIQKQSEEYQKALDESAQKTSEIVKEGTETETAAMDAGGDAAAQAAEDNADKVVQAANDTADKAAETVEEAVNESEDTEISADIGEKVLNAINESLSDLDGSQLQDINIGETLMNSIGKSLSADNMDFKELGFGESLMSAINESLSTENMDFTQLSIGESVMNGVLSSLESADLSGLDMGSRIADAVNANMGEGIEVNPNLSIIPGNIDTTGLLSAVTAAIADIAESNAGIAVTATISGTANYELGEYPTTLPDVAGISSYELGSAPTEAPDISGTANYSGVFPTSAPTIYGTVIYSAKTGHFAKGTMNAPEGLAYVNDDGSAEPYELIEHNGEFRMYEGRNVLTSLDSGDRVYTSSQTKDILSGRSIPHYAQGRNNDVIDNEIDVIQGGASGGGVNISMGGITVSIHVDGNAKGSIIEEIKSHSAEIAEVITDELDRHISATFANSMNGGG